MKPFRTNPRSRDKETGSSECSAFTEISHEICEQEGEIKSMFRNLVHDTRKQEVGVWILIAVIGFMSIIAFYLLWLKAGWNCGPYRALCGEVAAVFLVTEKPVTSYEDSYRLSTGAPGHLNPLLSIPFRRVPSGIGIYFTQCRIPESENAARLHREFARYNAFDLITKTLQSLLCNEY
ncbi:MAG TPA: hypothetical protein VHZ55_08860 [Bryobacteraceae bacterium]|jgi:hypothetical protein|nr:hypothetical protein [Bryobacteraceae bacterium]